MTIAKIVISGFVYRDPEKRFTTNDFPITSFTLQTDEKEQMLIHVEAKGNLAENVEQNVKKGSKIVVEGRLQNITIKNQSGADKKTLEIEMISYELVSGSQRTTTNNQTSEVVKFSETEDSVETLVGEEEIPF